jgi:hypothetical protein
VPRAEDDVLALNIGLKFAGALNGTAV